MHADWRRLASLTAGVGHEVKNPINAMVVHLELLRGKLVRSGAEAFGGASGMWRFCRARCSDWTGWCRHWRISPVRWNCICESMICGRWSESVMELTAAEMEENGVRVTVEAPSEPMMVRVDAELMRQALLNLVLNGMQAMPAGGWMRVAMRREHQFAVVEVSG